jgi:hypothetical protein
MANGGLIGALRVALSLDKADYSTGLKQAKAEATQATAGITKSFGALKAGLAGIVAGLSIGTLVSMVQRGIEYAQSLKDVAQQLGVTTEALQVYRYAGTQVGLTTSQMDSALGKLTLTIGEAADGAKKQATAFNELGINVRTADGVIKSTDQVLREMADALGKIDEPAKRARIETALLGESGAKLDTLLAGGSAAIDNLRNAAHRLGIVLSEDQIQRADEIADKLEQMKMVLEARIAGAVADNAGAILSLVDALAKLVVWAGNAVNAYRKLQAQLKIYGSATSLYSPWKSQRNSARMGIAEGRQELARIRIEEAKARLAGMDSKAGTFAPSASGLNRVNGPAARAKKDNSAEEAERRRQEALRREHAFESEQRRNQIDILRAQQDLTTDYSERTTLSVQMLDLERAQERADLKLAVDLGERSQAEADILNTQLDRVDALKRRQLIEEEQLKRLDEIARLERLEFDLRQDRLEGEASLARTAAERREIELRILELTLQEERKKIAALKATDKWHEAIMLEGELASKEKQGKESIRRSTMGPLESYMDSIPQSAAEMNEALESVAANGLKSLEDGLIGVLSGTKSVADAFRDMAQSIIQDLLRIQIQQMIMQGLSSIGVGIGAAGGGSGHSLGGSLLGLPGNAKGGLFRIGGIAGVDRNVLSINGLPVSRVSASESLAIIPDGAEMTRTGRDLPPIHIHITGPMTREQARQTGMQAAAGARTEIAKASRFGF